MKLVLKGAELAMAASRYDRIRAQDLLLYREIARRRSHAMSNRRQLGTHVPPDSAHCAS